MPGLINATIDHYQVQKSLARGGMAEIYLAEDTRTQQVVAIKVVPMDASEDFYERFRREVQTIAGLQHKHILPALDYGQYKSWSYLVMPYIEQGTLRELLARGPLSLKEAGLFLQQIAEALQFAHARGVFHRDIKTSNVLLRDKEYAYLADFGLVKRISDDFSLTRTGFLIGTPEYMAPELVDEPATVSSDVYALGIVLYEMLTGDVPFKGNTPVAVVMRHMRETARIPSRLNPTIPTSVDQVILRAIAKKPRQRFATPHDLATAYFQALESEARAATLHVAAIANEPTAPIQRATPPADPIPQSEITTAPSHFAQPQPRPLPAPASVKVKVYRHITTRPRWTLFVVSIILLVISATLLFAAFYVAQQAGR